MIRLVQTLAFGVLYPDDINRSPWSAEAPAKVKVALLDMSAVMPTGAVGYGMMVPGGMTPWTTAPGGTAPGMMGYGYGMMGPGPGCAYRMPEYR